MSENIAGVAPVGDQLRGLREAQGLDLSDIAARTRIPLRHLTAVEASDYAALPSQTYALGFVRSYARAVGASDSDLAAQLRAELGREPLPEPGRQVYEPVDPTRLPSKLLAWTALVLAILVIGGYALWRSQRMGSDDALPTPVEAPAQPPTTKTVADTPTATPTGAGAVVLTATAPVWVRISDGATTLVMRELAANERYEIPATATDPRIQTGKAEALTVTVNGKPVAPLGPPAKTIKNVSLKAAALTAVPAATGSVAPVQANGDNAASPAPAQ